MWTFVPQPFGCFGSNEDAHSSAVPHVCGCDMIKVKGGAWLADLVRFLVPFQFDSVAPNGQNQTLDWPHHAAVELTANFDTT
jgi:hypothetical protein